MLLVLYRLSGQLLSLEITDLYEYVFRVVYLKFIFRSDKEMVESRRISRGHVIKARNVSRNTKT
jgi:hypothetical protein